MDKYQKYRLKKLDYKKQYFKIRYQFRAKKISKTEFKLKHKELKKKHNIK